VPGTEEHGLRTIAATSFFAVSILLFAAAVPSRASAQQQAPAAAPAPMEEPTQGVPHLKANVDEVVLDLAVRERGHDGVPKLNPEDLIVTDEGTPVKLRDLHLVNVLTDPAKKPLVTILFDNFHGPIAKSTRALALKMLNLLPAKGFRMAVMDFDGRLRLVQGFTEDRAPIVKAVQLETESNPTVLNSTLSLAVNITSDDKAEAGKKAAVDAAEKELIAVAQTGSDTANKPAAFEDRRRAQALLQAMENADSIAQKQHVYYTVAALMALVNAQQSLRERRIIIYFTANRHMGALSDRTLRSVADSAAAAGISIYTIDMDATGRAMGPDLANAALNGNAPTGRQGQGPALGIDSASVRSQQGYSGHNWTAADDVSMVTDFARGSGEDQGDPFEDLHNPLQGVSKETGAAYIDALNGTNRALRNLAEDLTSYYEATFVPATKEYDGSFRKITIKPTRGDISIRGRKGYFALPPGVDPGLKPFELPMLKALEQSSLPHQFPFRAAVLRFGDLPNGNTNTLAAEVPLAGLQLQSADHSGDARVSFLAQVRDSTGVVVDHFAQQLVMSNARGKLGRNPEAALAVDHHFISAPGHYEIELVARDENSGKMSAQRREFDVAAKPGDLAISDMVLVRNLEPVSQLDLDPLEPLLFSRNKVTPELDRDLVNLKKAPAVFFLLHPAANAKDGLNLEMQLVRNGTAGKRTALVDLFGMQSAVPYMATIGSRPLPPGEYEIRAFLTQGGRTVEQSQHFVISGTQTVVAADQQMPVLAPFTDDDTQIAVDENNNIVPAKAPPPMQLPITPVTVSAAPPPVDQSRVLIDRARRNALNYESDVLPHFVCTEVTQRSVDANGSGKWRLQDTVTERVEYRGHSEARSILEVNGRRSGNTRQGMKGTYSTGEFGGVLHAVFRPAADASFTWKGSATLNGDTVEVYDYSVTQANSDFSVTGENGAQTVVGFHGTVFIDKAAARVRRITLLADNLPESFRTRSSSISVDYDYVPINGLRYLLPISAQLQARQGDREAVLNTMQFSDYRRAGNL
jgi:VWFA-related protein